MHTFRKGFLLCLAVFFLASSLALAGEEYPIMRVDLKTLKQWIAQHESLPVFTPAGLKPQEYASSLSLLSHLDYVPEERDQGQCGNCWVWAGTAITAIALDIQEGIHERLSTQFFNSCYYEATGKNACCGGYSNAFKDFYLSKGFTVPWENQNASWQDGSTQCETSPAVSCGAIGTNPSYGIESFTIETVQVHGVGKETAIANIKAALNEGKAVWFAFYLPTESDWQQFYNFWGQNPESAVWSPDYSSGHSWVEGEGGGHAVVIVGYDDSTRTWLVLNSWGTAYGYRPHGVFRMSYDINYDCYFYDPRDGYNYYSLYFEVFDIAFSTNPGSKEIATFTIYFDWDRDMDFFNSCLHVYDNQTFTTDDGFHGYWELWQRAAYLNFTDGCAPVYTFSMSTLRGFMKCTDGQQGPEDLPGYAGLVPGCEGGYSVEGVSSASPR